jgi:hypothetical protein
MTRLAAALFGGMMLILAPAARAADHPASGTWKFSLPAAEDERIVFLFMLSETDKGWVGDFLGTSQELGAEPAIEKTVVKDDNVSFTLKIGTRLLSFDGRVAKDGKKISGSLSFGAQLLLIDLLPSKLKILSEKEAFNLARETLAQSEGGQEFFGALPAVLSQATTKKLKPDEVRALVDRASKIAEGYGQRWQRNTAMRIANALVDQEAYVPVALEQARLAERSLKADDDAATQMQVLQDLVKVLTRAKKTDELKPIEARLVKLEARDYADYVKRFPPFKPDEFKGRKAKSDRVCLIELFTGSECPPCVAVDLACDALQQTYKPSEVIVLQYHLHIPGPDPMTAPDNFDRARAYGNKVGGTPALFFNGKADGTGGGRIAQAKQKYTTYREAVDEWLEKPAGAKIQLAASQKGNEISIKASLSNVAMPGDKVFLRFVLVEERVRFQGGNGLGYHHSVVRAFPGGVKGFAVTKKDLEQTATVDVEKVKEEINKSLDDFAKREDASFPIRPMALRNLRVVAFVQNDETGEVLQAAQVDVEEK